MRQPRPAARSRQRQWFWSTLLDLLMRDSTGVARAFGWNVSARGDAGSNAELTVDEEGVRRGELFGRVFVRRTRARDGGRRSGCDDRSDGGCRRWCGRRLSQRDFVITAAVWIRHRALFRAA